MSVSCNSDAQNCTTKCCDYFGECPKTTDGCYYYYPKSIADSNDTSGGGLSAGAITAIAIGGFLAVFFLVVMIIWCATRRRPGRMVRNPRPLPQSTSTTIMTQQITIPQPQIPSRGPQPAFNSMSAPAPLPPPYQNKNIYNTPEPYYP
jgi:hypothetical protein